MNNTPDSYSAVERRLLLPARRLLAAIHAALIRLLTTVHVTPNMVSFSQVPLGFAIVWLMTGEPRLAFLLFVAAVALDGLDGALARSMNLTTRFGAIFDQYCDHIREVTVVSGLALTGVLAPFLAGLYGLGYPLSNLTLYLCNLYRVPLPIAIKSYLFVYPAMFLYLWFGIDVVSPAVALSVTFMGITVASGLWRLRSAMDSAASPA